MICPAGSIKNCPQSQTEIIFLMCLYLQWATALMTLVFGTIAANFYYASILPSDTKQQRCGFRFSFKINRQLDRVFESNNNR